MAKDKANIFKLENVEEYKKDPFGDCFPGAENFAKNLKNDILTKDTPYVLLLEKGYGKGKTFFVTRFTQHLRNEKIDAIYFSAWENDYLSDPFLSFSKEILKYFHNISLVKKTKTLLKTTVNSMKKLTLNLAKSSSVSLGIKPFGLGADINIDNEKVISAIEELFDDFKKEKDPIQEFKEDMTRFINSLPKKRLVLIVDELDRCRPDYAMKVLEIIKHFFDIEGLFVIVPTNQSALENSLKALYGIDYKNNIAEIKGENYFKKFFTKDKKMPKPDYKSLVKDYIKTEYLSDAIDKDWLTKKENAFNSVGVLIDTLAKYGKSAELTLRQMTDICNEIIYICNNFDEKVRCEYLAYLICNEEKKKKNQKDQLGKIIEIDLNSQHPYFVGAYGSMENNLKRKTLDLTVYRNTIENLPDYNNYGDSSYSQIIKYKKEIKSELQNLNNLNFKNYKEINDFITINKTKVQNIEIKGGSVYSINNANDDKKKLIDILTSREDEIKSYRHKWGSDDQDEERQTKYKKYIE